MAHRAVLIIWILLPPNDPRQAEDAGVVARHLMQILSDCSSDDRACLEEVRLCCLIVGAFSAFIGGGGHLWFVERIKQMLQPKGKQLGFGLGTGLFESLIDLQKRVFYREAVTRPLTLRLAELLILQSRRVV